MVTLKEFVNQRKAINAKIVEQIAGAKKMSSKKYCTGDNENNGLCQLIDKCVSGNTKSPLCRTAIEQWQNLTPENINAMLEKLDYRSIEKLGTDLNMMNFKNFQDWSRDSIPNLFEVKEDPNIPGKNWRFLEAMEKLKAIFDEVKRIQNLGGSLAFGRAARSLRARSRNRKISPRLSARIEKGRQLRERNKLRDRTLEEPLEFLRESPEKRSTRTQSLPGERKTLPSPVKSTGSMTGTTREKTKSLPSASTREREEWENYFSQDRRAAFQAALASAQAKAERLASTIRILGGGGMFGGAVALGPQDDVVSARAKLANEKDIHMGALIENLVKEMKELLAAKGKQLSKESDGELTEMIAALKDAEEKVYTLADILVYAAKKSVKGEKIPEYEDNKLKLSEHLRTKINQALEEKVNNNVKEYRKIFNALTGLFNNAFLVM